MENVVVENNDVMVADVMVVNKKDAIVVEKISEAVADMSNRELLTRCKDYGRQAIRWRWKFSGLLPEVEKRKLWKEAGFESVFHFAKVLAGMSEMQVKQALRLERKFENLPKLQELFHEGKVSPNKLDRIVSVVTEENEEELAEVVQVHSKQAVETLVKDVLRSRSGIDAHAKDMRNVSLPGQSMILEQEEISASGLELAEYKLELSQEVKTRLMELKEKGFDLSDLLMDLLDLRENLIEEEKNAIVEEIEAQEKLEHEMWQGDVPRERYGLSKEEKAKKRYVNARTRRVIRAEHGTKCSIETCGKPAQELHHTRRFSLAPNNNPKFLAPLCTGHHELAARVDVRYLEYRKK